MAIDRMTKQTEAKLLRRLEKVADYISDGDTPNQAIVKVAKDSDLDVGHVKMMVHAYNNARTNRQRQSSNSLIEKTAKFDLADPTAILNELYPNLEKTAATTVTSRVSDDYSTPPERLFQKESSTSFLHLVKSTNKLPTHEDDYYVKKAWGLLKELDHECDNQRLEVVACENRAADAYEALDTYFRQPGHSISFKEAAANSTAMYGHPAKRLFETLEQDLPNFAKEGKATLGAMHINKAPYSFVVKCLDEIEKRGELKSTLEAFHKEASDISSQVLDLFMPKRDRSFTGSLIRTKHADVLDAATKSLSDLVSIPKQPVDALNQAIVGPSEDKLKTKAYMGVTDPGHEATLRGIRSQAMLKKLMDEDDFLQGEEPGKVTDLFNQIVKVSPRIADQPLAIKGLLRRYIAQGQVDPHDVGQLADIETKLKQRDEPQREYQLPKLPENFVNPKSGGRPPD